MLVRDFKLVDFTTDEAGNYIGAHADRVMKDLKKIRQHFGYENKNGKKLKDEPLSIDLRFHKSLITINTSAPQGYDMPSNYPMLYINTMDDKDGVSTWQFAKTANLKEGGKYDYFPRRENFTGRMRITDPHLIWYVVCVLPNLEVIPELQDIQNKNRGRKYYEIFDGARKARMEIEQMRMTSKVENFIVSEESPLTPEKIIRIAKSYGIGGADQMTDNQVRMTLLNMVKLEEQKTGEGYNKFIESSKVGKLVGIKASIQTGIDINKLVFDTKGASKKWRYGKDMENEAIMTNVVESRKVELLVDFFIDNPEAYSIYKKHIGEKELKETE